MNITEPPDPSFVALSEAHNENCSQFLLSMGINYTAPSEIEHSCLWGHDVLDTMGIGGMESGELGHLGSWWPQILVQLLYGIVCLIGLGGNTLVIYVVVRFSKMQTVTNLYLVNLAIADECFLVGIPFLMTTAMLGYWPFGNFMCKAYFTSTSINQITSSMFLLIMSADRYLAVCHPITAPKWRTPLIAKIVALTAWTISALLMVPIFMYANTLEIHNKVNCNIFWPGSASGEMIFIIYSFVLSFALPFILILVFYVLVINRLRTVGPRRRGQQNNGTNSILQKNGAREHGQQGRSNKERRKSHRKVTKLVFTVITVYFLCWAPYWTSQMALIFMPYESSHSGTVLIVFLLAGCLSYSNSTMNPILYAFLSDNFKKSFKKACTCASRKETNATLNPENSVFPRKRSQSSLRQRKSSAPLTSATFAGTGIDMATIATRSTVVPSSNIASPAHCHPTSNLLPVASESSSSENNVMNEIVTSGHVALSVGESVPATVHITINDHYIPDDVFPSGNCMSSKHVPSIVFSGSNGKGTTSIVKRNVNETFVEDNGVVVTVL